MNLDYEAIEHLKLALSRLSKAKRLLQNELMKVESCNNNRLSRSVIEESYVAAGHSNIWPADRSIFDEKVCSSCGIK